MISLITIFTIIITRFFLLLVEIVNNHTDKQIEREKRTENDEKHKIKIHINIFFANRLFPVRLKKEKKNTK